MVGILCNDIGEFTIFMIMFTVLSIFIKNENSDRDAISNLERKKQTIFNIHRILLKGVTTPLKKINYPLRVVIFPFIKRCTYLIALDPIRLEELYH